MPRAESRQKRCAIYTRKSSEEGLEQEFNSLAAQREACEAYIRSQHHEGWILARTRYDDGGFSGGTMERPALQGLLADIRAGRIDIVVVYKVDRLTRSLADFARLVEIFDAQGVSFVSVTQQFNTTSSMGRLTLNVLSFAQFEREVTGERIRDKIAASKQKGMWMGGNVPLGYDASGRMLVLNPAEAETVRRIFALYRELGYVRRVKPAIDQLGFRTKRSMTADGTERGDKPFSRGLICRLLANPIYTGQIAHKGQLYPGQHPALIDTEMWTAVQDQLAVKARRHRSKVDAAEPSLLTPWEVVRFPAIAETDEVHKIETIWGPRTYIRRQGEALHPEREPLDTLDRIRRTIGEYNFAGQYQQSPAPLGGGLVKREWFTCYDEKDLPERFDRIVQSWDTANKVTELSDFSVCTTWGIKGKNVYLLYVLRERLKYPDLKRAVREQQSLFNATVVLIEDKASGTQLIQELNVDGCRSVTSYKPECDKIMRLHAQTAMIENGFVYVPEGASWLAGYLHEMSVFPNGKHDDQVDSTAQFLDWFQKPMKSWGLFELYRQRYQEHQRPTRIITTWMRVRPPPGKEVGGLYLGPQLDFRIRPDGTFDIPAGKAEILISYEGWTKITEWTCEDAVGCVMKTPSTRPD